MWRGRCHGIIRRWFGSRYQVPSVFKLHCYSFSTMSLRPSIMSRVIPLHLMRHVFSFVQFRKCIIQTFLVCYIYLLLSVSARYSLTKFECFGIFPWVDIFVFNCPPLAEQGPVHKVKSIIMSLNFSSSQLSRISLAEFVSKLILI